MEEVNVQQIGNSLMVTIPKEIAEKQNINKGMILICGVDLIGGEYVFYYMHKKDNGSHKG